MQGGGRRRCGHRQLTTTRQMLAKTSQRAEEFNYRALTVKEYMTEQLPVFLRHDRHRIIYYRKRTIFQRKHTAYHGVKPAQETNQSASILFVFLLYANRTKKTSKDKSEKVLKHKNKSFKIGRSMNQLLSIILRRKCYGKKEH